MAGLEFEYLNKQIKLMHHGSFERSNVLRRIFIVLAWLTLAVNVGFSQTCTVNWTNVHQRIDGFGASSAWQSSWTTTEADLFFSTNTGIAYTDSKGTSGTYNGIGLSLLRNHITAASSPAATAIPSTSETTIMQYAQARGAKIWSTPWTPANGLKDNNKSVGGNFLSASNQAYASQLANYVYSMKTTYGITNFYAISIQNEPNANVSYESCHWTGQQFHDFVPYLRNALVAKGVGSTKIILSEDEYWETSYYSTAMSDPVVATNVDIVANHNYNNSGQPAAPLSLYSNPNAALWETEVSSFDAYDGSITNGVYWATRINAFLTVAQVNAWHFWWLVAGPSNTDNEGLTDNSSPTTPVLAKRMFVLGQWSRFVRPGYYRIDATTTGSASITAFNNTNSGNFAIVAINNTGSAISQTFNLANFTTTTVTPWMTTSNLSLASQTPVSVSGSSFTYTLPALSVVTFVGQKSSGTPPAATTVTLTSGANPSTYGSPVTFMATVQTNGVALVGISGETMTFYDGATTLGSGMLNSSGQAAYTTTNTQLSAVTHSITAVYGGDANSSASTNTPALSQTVNKVTLTVTNLLALDKVYDGTTNATLNATQSGLDGVLNGDNATLISSNAVGCFADKNVGTNKPVTVSGLALGGDVATNYTLLQPTDVTASITPTGMTVSGVTAASKVYDGTTNAQLSGTAILNGQMTNDDVGLVTSNAVAFFADATVGAKPVTVTGYTLAGADAGNYTLAQPAGLTADILALVTPVFTSPAITGGAGGWQLSFSGQAGQSYRVLASTNLMLPLNQWTMLTNAMFDLSGTATFTDTTATNQPQRFYQIGSP
jgi:glucuronoarabinoxylan endo-1,4-beta-xylanase